MEIKELGNKIANKKPGQVRAWRKSPGDLELAGHAASYYAKKTGQRDVIVRGNSYGVRVHHVVPATADLHALTAMPGEQQVLVVEPNGDVFQASAK